MPWGYVNNKEIIIKAMGEEIDPSYLPKFRGEYLH